MAEPNTEITSPPFLDETAKDIAKSMKEIAAGKSAEADALKAQDAASEAVTARDEALKSVESANATGDELKKIYAVLDKYGLKIVNGALCFTYQNTDGSDFVEPPLLDSTGKEIAESLKTIASAAHTVDELTARVEALEKTIKEK